MKHQPNSSVLLGLLFCTTVAAAILATRRLVGWDYCLIAILLGCPLSLILFSNSNSRIVKLIFSGIVLYVLASGAFESTVAPAMNLWSN